MIGKQIGPYDIVEELGRGGMSTVYRAYHPTMDRFVALKILRTVFATNPENLERFNQEARVIARLEHPHLLPVYDYSAVDDPAYIVMRYLEGATLRHVLTLDGKLPYHEVVYVVRQVSSALDYAHRQGVLHRDIKPSNVMIDTEGNVFLMDFGIAQIIGEANITQTGVAVGTPAYMSPEQIQDEDQLTPASDLYSFAVLIFELATGFHPFYDSSLMRMLQKHIEEPAPSATLHNPDLPDSFDAIMEKALQKDPEHRYATATEMARELEETLTRSDALLPNDALIRIAREAATRIRANRKIGAETRLLDSTGNERPVAPGVETAVLTDDTKDLLDTPGSRPRFQRGAVGQRPANRDAIYRLIIAVIGMLVILAVPVLFFLSVFGRPSGAQATRVVQTRIALAIAQTRTAMPTDTLSPTPSPTLTPTNTLTPTPTPTVPLVRNQVGNAFIDVANPEPTTVLAGDEVYSEIRAYQVNINHRGTELEDARLYSEAGGRILLDNVSNRGIELFTYFDTRYVIQSGGYTTGVDIGFEDAPLVYLFLEDGATCAGIRYTDVERIEFDCLTGACSYSLSGPRGTRRFLAEGRRVGIRLPDQSLAEVRGLPVEAAVDYGAFLGRTGAGEVDAACVAEFIPTPTPTFTPTNTPTHTPMPFIPPSPLSNPYR